MDYDLAVELTKLSLQIQEGYRELEAIKEETESLLAQREREAEERVAKALLTAKLAVEEASSYAKDVQNLVKMTQDARLDLKSYKEALIEQKRHHGEQVKEARKQIDDEVIRLDNLRNEMRKEQSSLEGLRGEIDSLRQAQEEEQDKINEDRKRLSLAMKVWKQQEMKTKSQS